MVIESKEIQKKNLPKLMYNMRLDLLLIVYIFHILQDLMKYISKHTLATKKFTALFESLNSF